MQSMNQNESFKPLWSAQVPLPMRAPLRNFHSLTCVSFVCKAEFISKAEVRNHIESLDKMRREAQETHHILEWTLQDLTADLALYYQNLQLEQQSQLPNDTLAV
jgi:hypothetical protein